MIAEVGTGQKVVEWVTPEGDTMWTFQGDIFTATAGSGILDAEGNRLFMLRNKRLISVDVRTGQVDSGPPAPRLLELISYDAETEQVYALTICCPNRLLRIDPLTGDSTVIAEVGTSRKTEEWISPEGDTIEVWDDVVFRPVSGPALMSARGEQVFFVRNHRLLTVTTSDGTLREGPPMEGMHLLDYNDQEQTLYAFTTCCPNRIMAYDLSTEELTTVAEVGTASNYFTVSMGLSVHDAVNERIYFNRNDKLISVSLTDPSVVTESETIGGLRLLGSFDPSIQESATREPDVPRSSFSLTVSPHPFSSQATVTVHPAHTQQVRLEIFDLLGRRIATLHNGLLPGSTPVQFQLDAGSWPSGLYLLRSTSDETIASTALVVTK